MLNGNALIYFFVFANKSRLKRTQAKRNNILFTAIYGRHINRPHIAHFIFPMESLTRLSVKIKVIVCRFTYFHHTHPIFSYLYSRNVKKETGKDSWKFIQAIDYYSQENLHNKRILHCTHKSILNMRLLKILSEYTQVIILSILFYSDWL